MSGPDDNELRNASLARLAASVTGPWLAGLHQAVAAQSYEAQASAMGASPEETARVLREVVDELSQTGAPGDAFEIARHRLAEGGDAYRPPKELRDAARDFLAAHGYSTHPEYVDAQAWRIQRLSEAYAPRAPWYRRWWRRVRSVLRGGR